MDSLSKRPKSFLVPVLLLLFLLPLPATARADVLHLKDGRTFSGSLVSEDEGRIRFRTTGGLLEFAAAEVERIEKGRTPADEFRERREGIADDDVAGLLDLAAWCGEEKLAAQRLSLLRAILKKHPDQAEARREMGEFRDGGAWKKGPPPEAKIGPGDRTVVPETRVSLRPPKDWKPALEKGRAVFAGPAPYALAPLLEVRVAGPIAEPAEAFPEAEGWEKPAEAKAAGLAGVRSRRTYWEGPTRRTVWKAVLGDAKTGVDLTLVALALQAEAVGAAFEQALSSLEVAAPPADYVNARYKYSLNLPKGEGWSHLTDEEDDLIADYEGKKQEDFARLVVIARDPGPERDDYAEFAAGFAKAIRAEGDLDREGEITVDGKKGRYIEGRLLDDGVPIRQRMAVVEHGKRLYLLLFTQHEYGKSFDEAWGTVVGSFRFPR